jgi:hypothetical protein
MRVYFMEDRGDLVAIVRKRNGNARTVRWSEDPAEYNRLFDKNQAKVASQAPAAEQVNHVRFVGDHWGTSGAVITDDRGRTRVISRIHDNDEYDRLLDLATKEGRYNAAGQLTVEDRRYTGYPAAEYIPGRGWSRE